MGEWSGKRMNSRPALVLCVLLSVACSDGGSASSDGSDSQFNDGVSKEEAELCQSEVRSLLSALQELDSRLNVGLNLDEYGDYVGDAQVAYDRLDFDRIEGIC
jgi:hypothetical protein